MTADGGGVRGAAAIVGVGTTDQGELPGRSADDLAVEALVLALDDAGLGKGDVDGLITCKTFGGASGLDTQIGALAGLNPRYSATLEYGTCNFSLHLAVMAIRCGFASTVALTYGTNQRSARERFSGVADSGDRELVEPYGFVNIAGPAALAFRRMQEEWGVTEEQLGHVAVAQRRYAASNPLAIFREPLSIEQYLDSPYLVRPLRRADLCMISDGGAALVVTAATAAACERSVHVRGAMQQTGLRHFENDASLLRAWARGAAGRVYDDADVARGDVDILYVQDATSVAVLDALVLYGFCAPEDVGPFVQAGETGPGGSLPVNTNGGQLSEAYMWGWLHLCEAVRQLRGEAGARQVRGASTAQYVSSQGYRKVASTILSTERE